MSKSTSNTTARPAAVIAAWLSLALAASAALAPGVTRAEPVRGPDGLHLVDSSQVIRHHGDDVCWYRHGWHGRGWYRCGFEWRTGFGWVRDQDWSGIGRNWRVWPRRHFHQHAPRPPVAHPPGHGGPAKPPGPGAPPKPGGPRPGHGGPR